MSNERISKLEKAIAHAIQALKLDQKKTGHRVGAFNVDWNSSDPQDERLLHEFLESELNPPSEAKG